MTRFLSPSFLRSYPLRLSIKVSSLLVVLFSVIFQNLYAQHGIKTDSLKPVIFLNSGASIYSSDEIFNQQILNKELIVENSTMSYLQQRKVLKLNVVQSIAVYASSGKKSSVNKKNKNARKSIVKVQKSQSVKESDFIQTIFNKSSSSEDYHFNRCIGRDCITITSSNTKASKSVVAHNEIIVRHVLDELYCGLSYYYSNTIQNNCFSLIYSVRPPPMV